MSRIIRGKLPDAAIRFTMPLGLNDSLLIRLPSRITVSYFWIGTYMACLLGEVSRCPCNVEQLPLESDLIGKLSNHDATEENMLQVWVTKASSNEACIVRDPREIWSAVAPFYVTLYACLGHYPIPKQKSGPGDPAQLQ